MEPFHAFLSINCTHCAKPLLRIGLSANSDIVMCPVCLKAGNYDDVLEEGAELSEGYDVPAGTRDLVRRLWAERAAP
jgi:phage FluMu protein Com